MPGEPSGAAIEEPRTGFERSASAFGAPFLFFLALPLLVYALNGDSVAIPKRVILESGLLATAVVAAALGLLGLLPRIGGLVAAAGDVVAVALFVLLLVPNRVGEIAGFGHDLPGLENRGPLLKLAVLVVLAAVACAFRPRPFRGAAQSIVTTAVLGALFVALFVRSAQDGSKRGSEEEARRLLALGTESNVIVLVLDTFTGYRMAEIVATRPEIRAALDGFTLYPRAIASALNTPAGSSAILTGKLEYAIEIEQEKERNTRSLESSFLAEAKRHGLDTAYISPLPGKRAAVPASDESSFLPVERPPFVDRLRRYLQFEADSSARILPARAVQALERLASQLRLPRTERPGSALDELARATGNTERARVESKLAFNRILDSLHVGSERAKILFVFNRLSHGPWNWTEEGLFEPGAGWQSSSIYAARAVTRLAEKLRALGAWDDALVVVASDHGGMPVEDASMGGLFRPEHRLRLEFNPLVMVKPPQASGPLRVSEMTVWLGDIAPTVRAAAGLPQPGGLAFASRSLLGPDDPGRELALPVFFRPDQEGYHDALKDWLRIDVRGTFEAFGRASSLDPDVLLSRATRIVLRAGVDPYATKTARRRFAAKRTFTSAWIEIGGRRVGKLLNTGVVTVSDASGRFQAQRFQNPQEGFDALAASRVGNPGAAKNSFVAAVGIPRRLAAKQLGGAPTAANADELVNCLFVATERGQPGNFSRCGPDDLDLQIDWPQR